MVDVDSIRYTMPTVAADPLEFVMPTQDTFLGAPQFHEDEWSQLEFFPGNRLEELKKLLAEYKIFESVNRGQYGWNKIYARTLQRNAILAGRDATISLASVFDASVGNSPILLTTSSVLGQTKSGFSIHLAEKVDLYGLSDETGITVLAAMLESGADDHILTQTFVKLNSKHKLVLIDWRNQMILTFVHANGDIDIWRP